MTTPPFGLAYNITSSTLEATTMPSHFAVRNPIGAMSMPYPRPTVSLDPRPVVIPILTSVIGFPIVVFALICALRQRAIKLRRRDHLKKMQAGVRSVTLDIPPREKVSFFSGCSSPDMSIKEMGEKLESFNLKPSLSTNKKNSSSKNNNHVKFVTPTPDTMNPANNITTVEVLLHADSAGKDPRWNGTTVWKHETNSVPRVEKILVTEPEICVIEPR